MSISNLNRGLRVLIQWILALSLLAASFWALFQLSTRQETKVNFTIVKECPEQVSMDAAYFDAQLKPEDQQGLMHCYCYNEVVANLNRDALDADFSAVKADDKKKYCSDWFGEYALYYSLEYGISLLPVVINTLVIFFFEEIGPFGRFYTRNMETEMIFFMITLF